jgi:hypothetical protein
MGIQILDAPLVAPDSRLEVTVLGNRGSDREKRPVLVADAVEQLCLGVESHPDLLDPGR